MEALLAAAEQVAHRHRQEAAEARLLPELAHRARTAGDHVMLAALLHHTALAELPAVGEALLLYSWVSVLSPCSLACGFTAHTAIATTTTSQ